MQLFALFVSSKFSAMIIRMTLILIFSGYNVLCGQRHFVNFFPCTLLPSFTCVWNLVFWCYVTFYWSLFDLLKKGTCVKAIDFKGMTVHSQSKLIFIKHRFFRRKYKYCKQKFCGFFYFVMGDKF